jgi:hypothetical protein
MQTELPVLLAWEGNALATATEILPVLIWRETLLREGVMETWRNSFPS